MAKSEGFPIVTGAECRWVWRDCDFWQISSHYLGNNRRYATVTMERLQEIVCYLSNRATPV